MNGAVQRHLAGAVLGVVLTGVLEAREGLDDGSASADSRQAPPAGADGAAGSDVDQGALLAHEALARGLDWLAEEQAESITGSFRKRNATEYAPVGVTSLAALAWMAAGTTPGRGPYGAALERAVDYLLGHVDDSPGSKTLGYIRAEGDKKSQMHGHGYAVLALAEAYTMSPRSARGRRIREALEDAVALIEKSQGKEGGWNYDPLDRGLHEGSITITLVQALRAAHTAGFRVNPVVIADAESYVERSQADSGRFRYKLHDDQTSIGLTAAAIATLNAAGTYEGPAIRRGTDAIWRGLTAREAESNDGRWPYYERLYVAQAFWQHQETQHFERWWPGERMRILETQAPDGSWHSRKYGDAYATAMNCIVLAIPEAVLPAFQR